MRSLHPHPPSLADASRGEPQAGFTLIEVLIALGILAIGLMAVVSQGSGAMFTALESRMTVIATDLARGKMLDIEEQIFKDGFGETDQELTGDFGEQGYEDIKWVAKIETVELPDFSALQANAQQEVKAASDAQAKAAVSGAGGLTAAAFEESQLGSMLALMGGGSGEDAATGALVGQNFTMFQEILKATIRRITLTVTWKVLDEERSMPVVLFMTDAAAMKKVIGELGSSPTSLSGGSSGGTGGSGGAGRSGTGGTSGAGTRRPTTGGSR